MSGELIVRIHSILRDGHADAVVKQCIGVTRRRLHMHRHRGLRLRRPLACGIGAHERLTHVARSQRDAHARVGELIVLEAHLHRFGQRLNAQRIEQPQFPRTLGQALEMLFDPQDRAVARQHRLEEADAMLKTSVKETDLGFGDLDEMPVDPCCHGLGGIGGLRGIAGLGGLGGTLVFHGLPTSCATTARATFDTPTTSGRPPRIDIESPTPSPSGARTTTD